MSTATAIPHQPLAVVLRNYFALLYVAVFAMMALFWRFAVADSTVLRAYVLAASASYAALYVLVPVALTALVGKLAALARLTVRWQCGLAYGFAYLGSTLTLVGLYADFRVYELYDYHLNGFVWNLVSTRGGIAALGATDSTVLTVSVQVGLFFVATALALWLAHRHPPLRSRVARRAVLATGACLFLTLGTEEGVYAYSVYTGQEDYLQAAEVVPFHLHTTANSAFKRMGIERTAITERRIASGAVDYPGRKLEAQPLAHYPNVIMLVAESFRWDLLDPEITPRLWAFSNRALRFEHHYSGGNRTRMGLFSMFYGLYAPYWYSFERERVAPALMNFLRERDYQLALHTSQSFDYPELRNTLFAGVSEQYMQELRDGEPWQRDTRNISDLIGKLEQRDRGRPFFGFMFFESTHAPYTFPADAALRPDYEPDLNYVKMNLQQNVQRIHARYVNAAHHVDREVGRLLDHLAQSGMLDDTIVLFTGDHGEEFMEKGHWGHGHNRSFPEEQIRVPLVLWLPGHKPAAIEQRTSHLQISPTLLGQLGVTQAPRSYSSAGDLFTPLPYFVASGYDYMAVFDEHYKISFPFTGSDFFRYMANDGRDRTLAREETREVVARYQDRLAAVVDESQRFMRRSP